MSPSARPVRKNFLRCFRLTPDRSSACAKEQCGRLYVVCEIAEPVPAPSFLSGTEKYSDAVRLLCDFPPRRRSPARFPSPFVLQFRAIYDKIRRKKAPRRKGRQKLAALGQREETERLLCSARTALPGAAFVLILFLMVCAAESLSESEIIFPEAAAIALGALVSPRLAWKTDKLSVFLLIGICASAGLIIVCFVPFRLEWQLVFAYAFGQLVLLLSRTSFAPLISAAVLPVLLQTRSLAYLAAALAVTAAVLLVRLLFERMGIRKKETFVPLPVPAAEDWADLFLRTLIAALLCVSAVCTGFRFLVCPPLLVAFTEFSRKGNGAMRAPVKAAAMLSLCAALGSLCRWSVCGLLGMPLAAAALLCAAAVLALVLWQRMYLPPSAAVAILAMLVPASELAAYPLQVLCGTALYVLCALFLFQNPGCRGMFRRAPHEPIGGKLCLYR